MKVGQAVSQNAVLCMLVLYEGMYLVVCVPVKRCAAICCVVASELSVATFDMLLKSNKNVNKALCWVGFSAGRTQQRSACCCFVGVLVCCYLFVWHALVHGNGDIGMQQYIFCLESVTQWGRCFVMRQAETCCAVRGQK